MYRRNRRTARLLALSAVLALGTAACGSDGDEEAETTTTVEQVQGSDMVTIDMADYAYNVSGPLTAGGMIKLTNSGKEFHVAVISKLQQGKTVDQFRDALMAAMETGGGGEGGTTTTGGGTGNILEQAGSTSTTAAGGRSGATTTTAGEQQGDPSEQIFGEFFEGPPTYPSAFVGPGQSVELTAPNLTPGSYGIICFIPTEVEGVPHFAKGMIGGMEVVEGAQPAEPTADATYKIAAGQAIQGPATLTAGRHTLKIEAAAGSAQLEPSLVKLDAGTTFAEFDVAGDALFEGDDPPPKDSANQVPGEVIFGALDLGGVTSFYVTADFTAGNYAMTAEDTDVDNPPRPPKELINIKVT